MSRPFSLYLLIKFTDSTLLRVFGLSPRRLFFFILAVKIPIWLQFSLIELILRHDNNKTYSDVTLYLVSQSGSMMDGGEAYLPKIYLGKDPSIM
jgi:hypothetical protein